MSFNESKKNTELKKCENSVKLVIDCDRPLGCSIHRSLEFHFLFRSIFYCWCFCALFWQSEHHQCECVNKYFVVICVDIFVRLNSGKMVCYHVVNINIFVFCLNEEKIQYFFHLFLTFTYIEDVNWYNTIQTQIQLIVILTLGIIDKMDFWNSEKKRKWKKRRLCGPLLPQ